MRRTQIRPGVFHHHWRRMFIFCLLGALFTGSLAGCSSSPETAIIVEWTTESEVDTAGFHLYRSESPDGPFERITEELIPASPDPVLGGHYVYTDTDVVPGRVYFYQLEDVEFDGTSTRHGPIEAKAVADGGLYRWWLLGVLLIAAALGRVWWARRPRS